MGKAKVLFDNQAINVEKLLFYLNYNYGYERFKTFDDVRRNEHSIDRAALALARTASDTDKWTDFEMAAVKAQQERTGGVHGYVIRGEHLPAPFFLDRLSKIFKFIKEQGSHIVIYDQGDHLRLKKTDEFGDVQLYEIKFITAKGEEILNGDHHWNISTSDFLKNRAYTVLPHLSRAEYWKNGLPKYSGVQI